MLVALYYPHTVISSRNLLKTALLLWDYVECIVPKPNWRFESIFKEKSYNEAIELIIRPHVPNDQQRKNAHQEVRNFLQEEGSQFFLQNTLRSRYQGDFLVYPDKFLKSTWNLLEHKGLARWDTFSNDYGVPPALGMLMMSSLADACAGIQKQKVTDRVQAYSLLERAKATLVGAPYIEGLDASQVAPKLKRLITISLCVLDARTIPIKKLLAFRKREAKGKSEDYRTMRLNYLKNLKKYVDRMIKEAKTKDDVKEIERQFKADMKVDLYNLKKELNLASIEPLFSREMLLTAMAVGGAFLEPISGLTSLAATVKGIGIIPLIKTNLKHRKERRKALLQNKISWLYLTQEKILSLR